MKKINSHRLLRLPISIFFEFNLCVLQMEIPEQPLHVY